MEDNGADFDEPEDPAFDPDAIRTSSFATARRGFDQRQVLDYLDEIASYVDDLLDRIDELESELASKDEELAKRPPASTETEVTQTDGYRGAASRIADLMRAFDEDVALLRMEAETEAERIVNEARAAADSVHLETEKLSEEASDERDRIVGNAAAEAERIVREARAKADQASAAAERILQEAEARAKRVLTKATDRHEALMGDVRAIRARLAETLVSLDVVLEDRGSDVGVVIVEDAPRP